MYRCRTGSSRSRHRVTIKGLVQGRFDSDEPERAIKDIVSFYRNSFPILKWIHPCRFSEPGCSL
ncbi:uncharacterized protein K441DRAFT_732583 [Cenococcum geophilum 1.58]|uniref:uncharacterized protein n=1 Tax=Cenococcum geophilum 1.58 TaxID=794803 RepID=UPI00358E7F32|nr:hypothetical protein K441DRAFT_732583 [Cenococcum geophilum 1.58]